MDRRKLHESMTKVLETAQKERSAREHFVQMARGSELGWVLYERVQMWDAVLRHREAMGKGPVPLSAITRVETMACGHSDYSRKFALYCAELVLSDKEPQP